jgi:hypothetical protein
VLQLSPGIAYSCFELLEIIRRYPQPFGEYRRSFTRIGVTSSARAIECAQGVGWAITDDIGNATLSARGRHLVAFPEMKLRLRQALLDYVDTTDPPWLQNAQFGRRKVLSYINRDIYQTFLEAGVVDSIEDDVVQFWDALASRARGQTHDLLLAIGRYGERLSLVYEKNRTGRDPYWVSIDSGEDGYDILSVVDETCTNSLSIEVKATRSKFDARFYVSRNEWNWAVSAPQHVFHLWDVGQAKPALAIVTAEDLLSHISVDQGEGRWENISVPFSKFDSQFNRV